MSKHLKIINNVNAGHYKWGDDCDGWYLLKNENLSVIQELVGAGKSEVSHYHKNSRQLFYILEGEAKIEADGIIYSLKKNDSIEIPPGIFHRLYNDSESDLKFLVISQPPSHGDRFLK